MPDRFTTLAKQLLEAWHKLEAARLGDPVPDIEHHSELRFELVARILHGEFEDVDRATVYLISAAMPSIFSEDYLADHQVASLAGKLRVRVVR
jgi:hypothetical protein